MDAYPCMATDWPTYTGEAHPTMRSKSASASGEKALFLAPFRRPHPSVVISIYDNARGSFFEKRCGGQWGSRAKWAQNAARSDDEY
jgi:hypothetical protein